MIGFSFKNMIKTHSSNENKQGAHSITERPEMARVRYTDEKGRCKAMHHHDCGPMHLPTYLPACLLGEISCFHSLKMIQSMTEAMTK